MTQASHQCAQAILSGMPPVMWFIRRHMRRHRAEGLSVPQFRILGLLDQQPLASQSCLCEHLGCTAPTVSRLVTGLIGKGLAVRKPCARDRRQVALALTPRGQQALTGARRSTRMQLAAQVEHLTKEDLKVIGQGMRLLGRTFANHVKEPHRMEPTSNGSANSSSHRSRRGVSDRGQTAVRAPRRRRAALTDRKG